MQDPPRTIDLDTIGKPDGRKQYSPSSTQPPKTPVNDNGYSGSISQKPETRRASSYDTSTYFAYRANPSSDIAYSHLANASGNANRIHFSGPVNGHAYDLASNPTNAEVISKSTYPKVGSRAWLAPTSTYLDFAPQESSQLSGEHIDESPNNLEHFNDPSRPSDPGPWLNEHSSLVTFSQSGSNSTDGASTPADITKEVHPLPKPALKRSYGSDYGIKPTQEGSQQTWASEESSRKTRKVSFEPMSGTGPVSADDEDSSTSDEPTTGQPTPHERPTGPPRRGRSSRGGNLTSQGRPTHQSTSSRQSVGDIGKGSKTPTGHPPSILPPEKVFPIQIGSELFRLSGASISSDAPSYFTQFFEEQIRQNEESGGIRTLYIDRDPETFRDVARHLQGYYVKPRDGSHFVKLFADAQFYSLPRLIDQLFEAEIFIQIGERHFQIPKDIFSDPGNSPNFFSLGFAVFFSTPGEVFPGLDRRGLLRPPSITPPYVPGRSAETFAQLLHMLRGYPLQIKDENHRAELLRDCRYFHLRGLEQKIIAHDISYNLERQRNEILLRIEDIKPSGISYKADDEDDEDGMSGGWVRYARPFIDDNSFELIVEIGGESALLQLDEMRLDLQGLSKARVSSLLQVIANKMNLPTNAPLGAMLISGTEATSHASPGHTPLSEDRVKVRFDVASDIILDGKNYNIDWSSALGECMRNGPAITAEEEDDSDAMSEDEPTGQQQALPRPGAQARQQSSTQIERRTVPIQRARDAAGSNPPRLETATASSRKRKRPATSSSSPTNDHGQWVIRCGQWRLRVQQNKIDSLRSGYEVVFTAVKVDAYSQERARNTRRKFLSASG